MKLITTQHYYGHYTKTFTTDLAEVLNPAELEQLKEDLKGSEASHLSDYQIPNGWWLDHDWDSPDPGVIETDDGDYSDSTHTISLT